MNDSLSAAMPSVDLTNCEREPIHTPGHVQPHGMLLALNPATLRVAQWSVNALTVLRLSAEQLRDRPSALLSTVRISLATHLELEIA